jgi:hypothetical protein
MNDYKHETDLSPVKPFDRLQPTARQFTGTPHVHRAYVLNRTTGKIVDACGHKHRNGKTAMECANVMLADALKRHERKRCADIARFAEQHCTTDVGKGTARAITEAIENDAL